MDPKQLLAVYRAMVTARRIDKLELELNNRGEAFFHVSGAGHEGTAILASLLHDEDWLLCHYRDKALMIARGVTPRTFFDGLFCKQASPTRGRQMCAHAFADRELKILSAPVPVGNAALQSVGVATVIKDHVLGRWCSIRSATEARRKASFWKPVPKRSGCSCPCCF